MGNNTKYVANVMKQTYGAAPIVIAAIWTALVQLLMGILGSFVLRRFPTEFSVGFFIGLLVVIAQTNLILFGTFTDPTFNMLSEHTSSKLFAALIFITALVYLVFVVMLTHFRRQISLAPADVKSVITRLGSVSREEDTVSSEAKEANYGEME